MKEDCEQGEEKRERERGGEEKKGEKEVERGERLESKKEREGGGERLFTIPITFLIRKTRLC